ncbi:hypothetical protein KSP39_PZI017889 [Platanthera zijinensis]|uniref:C2H2-type domain-containing protein n=1 Tax=Platanthera zijinensis TaxID=2320716 RepID=A0AAP0B5N1_9ASPA
MQHRKVHSDEHGRPLRCPWKGCKAAFDQVGVGSHIPHKGAPRRAAVDVQRTWMRDDISLPVEFQPTSEHRVG